MPLAKLLDRTFAQSRGQRFRSFPSFSQTNKKPAGGAQPCPRVKEKRSNGNNICNNHLHPAP